MSFSWPAHFSRLHCKNNLLLHINVDELIEFKGPVAVKCLMWPLTFTCSQEQTHTHTCTLIRVCVHTHYTLCLVWQCCFVSFCWTLIRALSVIFREYQNICRHPPLLAKKTSTLSSRVSDAFIVPLCAFPALTSVFY